MLKIFEEWKIKKEQKKLLLEFYWELKKNLESYYVMDQLGRFRFFRMESWMKVRNLETLIWEDLVLTYVRRLEEYNALLDDFTKYEKWYSADVNNKTQATAHILHDKREEPRKKFEGLESVIKFAIGSFEKNLFNLEILKYK